MSNKSYKLSTTIITSDDKKENHNTGVRDGIKKTFNGKLFKNLINGTLSRNLIKSIKK